ncbi:MAG: polysaccharide deacetylase family protein [Phycisphaerae bacterium]|nr:polysaccharide deacetylase family protein [Phycisphaerae bacterium]
MRTGILPLLLFAAALAPAMSRLHRGDAAASAPSAQVNNVSARSGRVIADSSETAPCDGLVCLMYHRFVRSTAELAMLPGDAQAYAVTAEQFDRQLTLLADAGSSVVSLAEALAIVRGQRAMPPRPVLITIDDGCESVISIAAPLLLRHRMPATVFITTDPRSYVFGCREDPVAPHDPRLTDGQIREWCAMGFDVGSHGVTHRALDSLNAKELAWELAESRRYLRVAAGREATVLAAPRGRWDVRVQQFARDAGYDAMFTSIRGTVAPGDDAFALKRRNVSGRWSESAFLRLLSN